MSGESKIPIASVAFVCTANLCRSLMAQAIFDAEAKHRKMVVKTLSAGLSDFEGMMAIREARLACERHETPMQKLISTFIERTDLSAATRVFVVERSHMQFLTNTGRVSPDRVQLLGDHDPMHRGAEIDDPTGMDSAAFDACHELMRDCIRHYLDATNELPQAYD